jgi:hypothetical protein
MKVSCEANFKRGAGADNYATDLSSEQLGCLGLIID